MLLLSFFSFVRTNDRLGGGTGRVIMAALSSEGGWMSGAMIMVFVYVAVILFDHSNSSFVSFRTGLACFSG